MTTHMETRVEFADMKTRPPATGERSRCCDVCHETATDCAPVVCQHRGTEVRVQTCRLCLKRHVLRKQDRARFDLAIEARSLRDSRRSSTPATGGNWRAQLASLKATTEAARYRRAVRR